MEFYLIVVVLLFLLAISDLVVGVSNDAVNFLNSALGSRVASRRTILLVVSFGVVIGATFASGMMEVARKGIFNPQFFSFAEVMAIFLAVMLTDIMLLDLFNTFGLPTSTTVSIVFELLGAAVAVSLLKISASGESWATLGEYINTSSALAIITGIFLSVGIAFTLGALVQYITRLLLTFRTENQRGLAGVLWSGLALAAITYFLIIKGLKGASFVGGGFKAWVNENTLPLLLIAFVGCTLLAFLLRSSRINMLRMVVLAGTFALAMAFAGNDLVNFIGVPLAGFESYLAWSGTRQAPEAYMMDALAAQYPAKTYLLLIAGLIMVVTLWLSRKARSVTETEINLGRQAEGLERFPSNSLARGIVRFFHWVARGSNGMVPNSWQSQIEESFQSPPPEPDPPAFDLVRASVNLTMASGLIALATSYKLPLSTTYVSFMVAMGTSLADRAWGRDSAVYRVVGVLNVIGGWFMTAFIAFTVAATFAYLIRQFELWAVGVLVAAAVFFIYNTFRYHQKKQKRQDRVAQAQRQVSRTSAKDVINQTAVRVADSLAKLPEVFTETIHGLVDEDGNRLRRSREAMQQLRERNAEFQYTFHGAIRRTQEELSEGSRTYLLAYDLEQDLLQSAHLIVQSCADYVADLLPPLDETQEAELRLLAQDLAPFFLACEQAVRQREFGGLPLLMRQKQALHQRMESLLTHQIEGIKAQTYSARNSMLYFSLLLETKDLIAVAARLAKLYYRLEEEMSPNAPYVLVAGKKEA